ncbi:hypothetical protein GCM10008090_11160 [Arenicella chitinivorans]|uniref:Lipoprotein n=1 Tax=Arenicella chitinivorans TaxID=1329800 RepID=A0A918RL49_9GAMM|nr:hypothetical protein [Arenicella chitinivorans]GHA03736.1 hypothetical protein GCM10008090_11160 [Arenicella chitinivorans]
MLVLKRILFSGPRYLLALFFVVNISACATTASSEYAGGPGQTIADAVKFDCVADMYEGITREQDWVVRNYPGFRKAGQALVNQDGNVYDKIYLEKGRTKIVVYFEITEWFGVVESNVLPEHCHQ